MRRPSRALAIASLVVSSTVAAQSAGELDPTFNAAGSFYGGPGWLSIPIDPNGRPPTDAARTITIQADRSIILGGLGGIDPTKDHNGLLAVAKLNHDGSAPANWSNSQDMLPAYAPVILLPHEFDFIDTFAAGFNGAGNHGVGFAGSGRVVTGTVYNHAKTFALAPGGATINGGLGLCEHYLGGALRSFYALGAGTHIYDRAFIAGYVFRYGDGAYLVSNCRIIGSEQTQVVYSDGLPTDPPGLIGHVGVVPHFSSPTTNSVFTSSQRLFRNFNSGGDNDALVCATSADERPGVGSAVGCSVFEPNLGGHLDDLLRGVIRIDAAPSLANGIAEPVVGLVESQIEAMPAGQSGDDRRVLTLARPYYRYVTSNGMVFEEHPRLQRSIALGDATNPPATLSFHFPHGVSYRAGNVVKLWVAMAVRPFPGPDRYTEIALVRFNFSDLSLDTTWGNGTGWTRYDLGAEAVPHAIALDAQGNVVIAGSRRYNPNTDDWDFFAMRVLKDDVQAPQDAVFGDGFE